MAALLPAAGRVQGEQIDELVDGTQRVAFTRDEAFHDAARSEPAIDEAGKSRSNRRVLDCLADGRAESVETLVDSRVFPYALQCGLSVVASEGFFLRIGLQHVLDEAQCVVQLPAGRGYAKAHTTQDRARVKRGLKTGVVAPVALVDDAQVVTVHQEGFRDMVVWNPWSSAPERFPDLPPDGHRHFLCIESAAIERPVELAPGAQWHGRQRLEAARQDFRPAA